MADQNTISKISNFDVEEGVLVDNLAIVLVTYFERHLDRPDNDPETEHGWGEWAEQKANEAVELIADQIAKL